VRSDPTSKPSSQHCLALKVSGSVAKDQRAVTTPNIKNRTVRLQCANLLPTEAISIGFATTILPQQGKNQAVDHLISRLVVTDRSLP
jgi:hypothetical protein